MFKVGSSKHVTNSAEKKTKRRELRLEALTTNLQSIKNLLSTVGIYEYLQLHQDGFQTLFFN